MTEISSQSSNTEEGEPANSTPTKLEVWTDIVGGSKKRRLRGLGSQRPFRARSLSSTYGFDMQNWQIEKRELLNRMADYETKSADLRQQISRLSESHSKLQKDITFLETQLFESQAKHQDDFAFLKAQFAMLQQQQHVGGSSYYPSPSRPPNSGHEYSSCNRSRLSKFMPIPGSSSASHDTSPPDPCYQELVDDDDEQELDD